MKIDTSIFKAYDIRGTYPEQFNEDAAYALGRAYATFFLKSTKIEAGRKPVIAVGSDMRVSSPSLKAKVIEGLLESGLDVVDIGLNSTPTFYYAVAKFGYDGGLQISASHNPKNFNGIKIVRDHGIPVSKDSGLLTMRDIIVNDEFIEKSIEPGQLTSKRNVVDDEVQDQLSGLDYKSIKPFKIVIDGSNGMGSVDMEKLFANLPCDVTKINFELDGTFPAHGANPMLAENTKQLQDLVISEHADLGIAPDGDGDRIFFFDEKGELLPQAILRGIMAQIELKNNPGALVCYDIRPGRITKDMIESVNGKYIVTAVGHSIIKEAMIKNDAVFGGESSGHYFYKLPYGTFEAPMILVTKFLKFISEQNKPLSEIVAPYKVYFNSGEVNTDVGSAQNISNKIEEVKNKYSDGAQIFIDGLTVEYPDYWFNLRGSNTEPLIRLTVEAKNKELMENKLKEILAIIES